MNDGFVAADVAVLPDALDVRILSRLRLQAVTRAPAESVDPPRGGAANSYLIRSGSSPIP